MAQIDKRNVIISFKVDNQQASKGIDKVEKQVTGLSRTLETAAGTFAGVFAVQAINGAAAALSNFARNSVQLAINAEQTQVAFETFLGSAEKANQVISELNEFSALTPFEPDQVIRAGQSLLAFGVDADELTDTLKALGDVASGTGTDFNELAEIYGKAKVQGRLFSEDINQLTGRGIPIISEFAKQFGVAESEVKKLVENGSIGFKELEQAFTSLTSEGGKFFDLTAKQSQTVAGRISTLVGLFNEFAKALGQAVLPTISVVVDKLSDFIGLAKDYVGVSLSDTLRQEQTELNVLKTELIATNTSQERRLEIIGILQNKYPSYLANINAETASNEDLVAAIDKINASLSERIRLTLLQETADKELKEATSATRRELEQRAVLIEQINKVNEQLATQVDLTGKSIQEQASAVLEAAKADDIGYFAKDNLRRALFDYNLLQELSIKATEEATKAEQIAREAIQGSTESIEQQTEVKKESIQATKALTKEEEKAAKKRLKFNAKFLEEFRKLQEEINDEYLKLVNEGYLSVLDADKENLEKRRQERIRQEQLFEGETEDEFQKQLEATRKRQNERLDALQRAAEQERNILLSNDNLTSKQREDIEDDLSEKLKQINIERLKVQLSGLEINSNEYLNLQQEIYNKEAELARENLEQERANAEERLKIAKESAEKIIGIGRTILEAQQQRLDEDLDLQRDRLENALILAEKGGAEQVELEERRLQQIQQARERNAKQLRIISAIEVAANNAVAISAGIRAISEAFASGNIITGIAESIALASTIATVVSSFNNAFADLPAFADGTEFFDGVGTGRSDSNLARISRGERIVPTDKNMKYFDTLNEFQRGTATADFLHKLAQGEIDLPSVRSERIRQDSAVDTQRMEGLLEGINKRLDKLEMNVTLDKNGFAASMQKYMNRSNKMKNKLHG